MARECGLEVFSFNLNELNYAPEIAAAMLKKQAAAARDGCGRDECAARGAPGGTLGGGAGADRTHRYIAKSLKYR